MTYVGRVLCRGVSISTGQKNPILHRNLLVEEATHKSHNSWEWKKLHTSPTTHGNGRSYTQVPQLMGMEEATHKSHNSWEWKKLHTSPTTHGDLLMEEATHKSHNSWEWKKLHTSPTTHGNLLMEEATHKSHNSWESVDGRSYTVPQLTRIC
ncbi:hypothetical protein BgiBS90_012981 [Biomphalaria glabrata]|nr:hypothetical protein BgiBS90_012981 [Biomphalaria glabrata]